MWASPAGFHVHSFLSNLSACCYDTLFLFPVTDSSEDAPVLLWHLGSMVSTCPDMVVVGHTSSAGLISPIRGQTKTLTNSLRGDHFTDAERGNALTKRSGITDPSCGSAPDPLRPRDAMFSPRSRRLGSYVRKLERLVQLELRRC